MVKILSAKGGGEKGHAETRSSSRVSPYPAARLGAAKGRVDLDARGYICARGECSANGLRGGARPARGDTRARVSGFRFWRAPLPPAVVTRARYISMALLAESVHPRPCQSCIWIRAERRMCPYIDVADRAAVLTHARSPVCIRADCVGGCRK
jgi:hypothetical protein